MSQEIVSAMTGWIDWAYGSFSAGRYAEAAYNLDQFDILYNSTTPEDESEYAAFEKQNSKAYVLRSMLAERNMQTAGNSWWAPFLPGTTTQAQTAAAAEAQRAAAVAAASAKAAGNSRLVNQAGLQYSEIPGELKKEIEDAPNAYLDALKNLPAPFGVPLWAWGLGAVGLYFVIKAK